MPYVNVLNRYMEPVEIQFDAAYNPDSPYVWQPGEVKALPQEVAMFCRRKSVIKEDPITGKQVRALVVQGVDKDYEDQPTGVSPLMPHRGPELLDRSNMDKAAQEVTYLPIANPQVQAAEREAVVAGSHARRVS